MTRGPVEGRIIVGPHDQEVVAVVSIPIPAGGEVRIDPTWRFHGWLRKSRAKVLTVRPPKRYRIDAPDDDA